MRSRSYVYGTEQSETLRAEGDFLDYVYGRGGDDYLYGDGGRDRLYGDDGNDHLYGLGDWDKLYGGAGNDQLYGNDGDDRLDGDDGDDLLSGGKGNDTLNGGSGDDWLYGGSGNDTFWDFGSMHDEGGNDTYYGGGGADLYRFFGGYEAQHDRIMDFEVGVDHLTISGNEFNIEQQGNNTVITYSGIINYSNASTNTHESIPYDGDVTLVGVDKSDLDFSIGNGLYV